MLNKKFKILKYLMIAFWMYITPFTIFVNFIDCTLRFILLNIIWN
ncbi:hypothetical protein A3Q56_06485 [Intoshia linei]|uniref:Uncharacterized protein n=1 Tax=Intoshia linei TaxID=1819745 RepID=A0A177AVZ4_9BILA|nr:hypothetical protein A3Q56_06485 [Intoshia linei]